MVDDLVMRKLIQNNVFFVIPSWSALLGYPTLGKYVHHNVSKIAQDLVIFFGTHECAVSTEKGILYFLFGLGYYYTKFELQTGNYIIDNRQLTGLVLSDFVYDHLATSKNITLENDKEVIVNEYLFKLPLDLSHKSETQKAFIQGILMRNLFIPYKDIFLELMELLQKPDSFQIDNYGHMFLSTHWDYYNKLLISNIMNPSIKSNYLHSTAGLNEVSLGADHLLNTYFSQEEYQELNQFLKKMKELLSNLDFDPMYLFSIIENAFPLLKSYELYSPNLSISSEKRTKEFLLLSAEPYINSFAPWPIHFQRKTKKELEATFTPEETTKFEARETQELEEPQIKEIKLEQNQFEIRTQKRPFVEIKPLPIIPISNTLQIFLTLKKIVESDYDMQSIGKAFEIAHNYIKSMVLHSKFLWEMSKFSNLYQRADRNLGLNAKEKFELLESIDKWIDLTIKD